MDIHIQYFLPVLITLIIFCVIFAVAALFTLFDDWAKRKHDVNKSALYYALKSKRLIWLISAMFWRMAYYICVLIAFISSVTIVYISVEESSSSTDVLIFSIITTVLVLFEFVIKPKENSVVYRQAFFQADAALNKYTYSNDASEIADALTKGEEIINKSYSD